MDIRALRYFVKVVQSNGFNRASKSLFVTQSAISRSILRLEDELGCTLIKREQSGLTLTDDGMIIFDHAKIILSQFESMHNALREKSGPLSGNLNIGLPPVIASTFFSAIIKEFSSCHPLVELKIFELSTTNIYDAMQSGKIETAAVLLPFDDNNFELQKFGSDRLVLLVNENHPLVDKEEVDFIELIEHKFVFFSENLRVNELIHSAFGVYNKKPEVAGSSNHLDLIIAMVVAGVGITLLPESMCRARKIDGVVTLPVSNPILSYELALVNFKGYKSRNVLAWNVLARKMLGISLPTETE
ncbi:LysR family transcriptional regulator [Dickeya parazeae]|uniref:Transcriptional regulator, LysR family n=1 Tax=Dickeya zeae (strain Ech586) TaxID=590409 RepID=D2BTL7_DICZ5|nr:LysR family transcriptional regulator [Dickeya parazeae]ACZ77848.1 transcriptional regulator, LysR family [Dickeya parazeae Ech586]MBP2835579.1 LysR family transcriptional regulator [Dickeya parazeae]